MLCAQAQGGTGGVHRHVAAANDTDPLTGEVGDLALAYAPEQLHGADDVFGILALQTKLLVCVSADGDIHRVKAVLNVFHGQVLADGNAGVDLNAGGDNMIDVPPSLGLCS